MSEDRWKIFKLDELAAKVTGDAPKFHEFLRAPSISCAVYHLPAGARDMQAPHLEDELYLVVAGRARLDVGGEQREVKPGMLLYVRATEQHSFFQIEEDLTLIAVFGAS